MTPPPTLSRLAWGVAALVAFAVPYLSARDQDPPDVPVFPAEAPAPPLGLPPVPWPKSNPYSAEKAELGWMLFYDARLSGDGSVACASCHSPERAFTDGRPTAVGTHEMVGPRNAPSVINAAYNANQLWDGRARRLETQARLALRNVAEMDTTDEAVADFVRSISEYRRRFQRAFGQQDVSVYKVAEAIATYERLVLSGNSPYDRFVAGDTTAMSGPQQRGMRVFFGKGNCTTCHPPPLFTDGEFANIGIGMSAETPDLGRFRVTTRPINRGAFKTPGLREVALTAPYMHDGSIASLDEVLMLYHKGGNANPWLDADVKHIDVSDTDVNDLVAFLKALSGTGWQHLKGPATLPF